MSRISPGPAQLDLSLDEPGRHWGSLRLPWSRDTSAYGQLVIPVAAVCGRRAGPTALLVAGVHGDEYEGQLALRGLARTLDPDRVCGRVIFVPAANLPAVKAGRRTSPVDGGNLARVFPGDPAAGLTSQIAEGFSRLLFPQADVILDLHGGGSSLDYLPCAFGRLAPERAFAERVLDALLAFGAPLTAVAVPAENRGTLLAAALDAGKVAVATEVGGGGTLSPGTLAVMCCGVERFLAHAGILPDKLSSPVPTRLLAVRPEHFLRSPGPGVFEPLTQIGDVVRAGQPAGLLHDLARPQDAPQTLAWPADGLMICRRVPALVESGDVLGHLAADVERGSLLDSVCAEAGSRRGKEERPR